MLTGKRVFLTGGAGFIGTTLVQRLAEHNQLFLFDNLRRNSLKPSGHADHPHLKLIVGDVTDAQAVSAQIRAADPHIIIHLAAVAGIDTVIRSPTTTMRVNLQGTQNVLAAAHELSGLERLVNFSTSEVFGDDAFRADENRRASIGVVGEARWTYAVSKLAGEHLAHAYHTEFQMPVVNVRPFNVYGPGQVGEGAIHRFVTRAIRNEPLEISGDGSQVRAWCYVDDMADGIMLALTHPAAVGESFNIGNARAVVTIFGLANVIVRVLDSRSEIVFRKSESADIELRSPNVAKARELLGFEARVGLEEGILRTAEYYRRVGVS